MINSGMRVLTAGTVRRIFSGLLTSAGLKTFRIFSVILVLILTSAQAVGFPGSVDSAASRENRIIL